MTVKDDFLKRRAFTLIELLVVIAIIAILAAILFPVFAQARAKARQTACLSNMKQAGLSVTMYREDFDAHYPRGYGNGGTDVVGWADAIQPYAKNIQFLHCPDDPNAQSSDPTAYGGANGLGPAYTTYFYNISLAPQTNVNGLTVSLSVIDAAVAHPASSIMIGDGIAYDAGNIQPYLGTNPPPNPVFANGFYCSGLIIETYNNTGNASCGDQALHRPGSIRHSGGANYAFADGHAKWAKQTALYGAATPFSVSGSSPTFNISTP